MSRISRLNSPLPLTPPRRPVRWRLAVWAILALLLVAGFIALGNWQLERRVWKQDLIADVTARADAAPVPAPGPSRWDNPGEYRYRHVRVSGHYLHEHETLVHGTSSMGYGYWVMTPLATDRGFIVLINRGHIPESLPGAAEFDSLPRPEGRVELTGLLRLTQPDGDFLRANQPADNRWYSRDVDAIAAAAGLATDRVASYFIDMDARPQQGEWPAGGLTVVSFHDNHLSYAITWYVLALGVTIAVGLVFRRERGGSHRQET